ncbi:MBL fold metallo-hydrolase [Candidatus Microgenomates bacterium]|nr:MBL fold metallo-hydrolase [Candidatus Microgenomates bacterium]
MPKVIITTISLLISLVVLSLLSLPDRNLHVIFCDVGQGDAILATYGTTQILVDGGPDSKVLSCLSRHMPFWDRTVEGVLLTHPQEDHFGGLVDVVRRFEVGVFAHPDVEGTAAGWKVLKEEITRHAISEKTVHIGDIIRFTNIHFDIFNPSTSSFDPELRTEGLGTSPSRDLNDYSVVGTLSFGQFDVLFTGDISPKMIPLFIDKISPVEVLKVPHHGSKNGLTRELLEKSHPVLAAISVGKNNRYGHPHSEVIRLLDDWGIRVLRTDKDGEVEVVSDGERWWIRDSN